MKFLHDRAQTLNYSDDPEHVTLPAGAGGGVLCRCDVAPGRRQRLLYYHENTDSQQRVCAVRVVATSDGTVLESLGTVNTGGSPLTLGHLANAAFLRELDAQTAWRTVRLDTGETADIQPGVVLGRGAIVTGLIELAPVSGSAEVLVLWAESMGDLDAAQSGAHRFPDDRTPPQLPNFRLRIGIFDLTPLGPVPLAHTAGGADGDATIGLRPLPNTGTTQAGTPAPELDDTFGVFTHVAISITNPSPAPARVALYQSAHGGDATATYWIRGKILESGKLAANPDRDKVFVFPVPGNGTVAEEILVSIDPGSSGPIHLLLGADQTDVAAPGTSASVIFVPGDGRTFTVNRPAVG